jgi:hypothetical protein
MCIGEKFCTVPYLFKNLNSSVLSRVCSFFALLFVCSVSVFVPRTPLGAQLMPDPPPKANLPPYPCHKKGCRADESIVMDLDLTHYATDRNADVTALAGDIEAQIDAVAARHPIIAHDGMARRIIWTNVDGPTHECQQPTDAGILEIEDAEILDSRHQYVFVGQQREEARIAFRILGCAGDERLRFPDHGTASIVVNPTYFSIYGTVGLVALLESGSNTGNNAAVLATVEGNSSLEPDIGAHSQSNLRSVVRDRFVYGKKSKKTKKHSVPVAGSLEAFFSMCRFTGVPITMICGDQTLPTASPTPKPSAMPLPSAKPSARPGIEPSVAPNATHAPDASVTPGTTATSTLVGAAPV